MVQNVEGNKACCVLLDVRVSCLDPLASPPLVRLIGVMWRPEICGTFRGLGWGGKKTHGGFKVYAPFPFFQEFKHFLMIEAVC